jgi:hypothetical protein
VKIAAAAIVVPVVVAVVAAAIAADVAATVGRVATDFTHLISIEIEWRPGKGRHSLLFGHFGCYNLVKKDQA